MNEAETALAIIGKLMVQLEIINRTVLDLTRQVSIYKSQIKEEGNAPE